MRAGTTGKLLGMVVTTVLLLLGARSCLGSGGQAGSSLTGLFHQGVAGVCADAASEGEADDSGSATSTTFLSASQNSRVSGMAQLAGLGSGTVSCPTTTTSGAP